MIRSGTCMMIGSLFLTLSLTTPGLDTASV